jgi:phage terminase large subunit
MSSATANPLDSGDSRYRTHPKTLEDLINPTERQREFLKAIADKDYVLYGGAAGGGKSYILRWWLIIYLIWLFRAKGLRNARVGLFCETYRTLSDRQIVKMRVEIPKWLGELHGDDFRLRPEYGSGEIALRNLDDPSKYYSAEFAAIAVDELTRNPLSVFNDLRFRLRWQHVERPKFAAATNPGGPGHRWVKAYWHDKQFPAELEGKRDQFVMVRALASDNPYIDETYYQSLLTLPPDMARKVAHGDWDVYTGQYFPNFNPAVHVIPHKEALKRIQPWYTRGLSGDWGFEHPHCFHWHAKDERNTVITHHELWDRGVGESEVGSQADCRRRAVSALESKLNGFAFSWDAGRFRRARTKASRSRLRR